MKKELNEVFQVSPYFVFFLVHSVQVGVGILGFQQSVVTLAGNDSWIPVVAAGIGVHIIIWVIFQLLNRSQMDLIEIHKYVFGKWIGNFLTIIWAFYFMLVGMTVLFSYIEVIRVWMFPELSVFLMALLYVVLVVYTIFGGFRTVAGICFLGVVIPAYLIFTFMFPIPYSDFTSLFPVWNHSINDLSKATHEMTLSYLGFSTLLIYYPFIKEAKSSHKWAQMGVFLTLLTYLLIIVVSISYFSEQQLIEQLWATLTLWKIVEMPVVERFEYIGITSWALIILPNVCLTFWAASRSIKQTLQIPQKYAVLGIVTIVLISSFFFTKRDNILFLNNCTTKLGFYSEFVYVPILFLLYLVIAKVRKKKND
ncbi:spore gernimation protein GerB [Bacillus sp. LL01]|uniref:GerAB/ArcD/ProY family transporter n=1 Tax=Bacillus sp. LL01 TaxID=1665556 RepID=UPI00064CE415|nr:GerAB/ArcD/ProY family transporter [Bacillus sp. LL01]KMJ57507.1 spore gernimation protein GerB [Bacillus sp. LL01]